MKLKDLAEKMNRTKKFYLKVSRNLCLKAKQMEGLLWLCCWKRADKYFQNYIKYQ